ncbi:MAG: carbon-nitrogen hydrolase family protein [Leptolyngbyaceae bacterium]|nr:carbon-nitrogen hydrolase family protein [Leptolyngbyaceae bacterium]
MKICAVQFRPVAGDILVNLAKHLEFVDRAITHGADVIFFPELSLTGYEPQLARSLATDPADSRLDVFQQRSDRHSVTIGVGLPLTVNSEESRESKESKVQIGMVWFTPNAPRRSYAKQHLHEDELPFFVAGSQQLVLEIAGHTLAPAICYESLQSTHADHAAKLGANVYLASVAKPAGGMAKAMQHYPAIAQKHKMYVILSDSVGPCDTFISVGQSAVWNPQGEALTQMDSESEGLVMLDTTTQMADVHVLQTA